MKKLNIALIILLLITTAIIIYEKAIVNRTQTVITTAPPIPTDINMAPTVEEAPFQRKAKAIPFQYHEALLEPVYEFIVTARVLSKKNYTDAGAQYAPTDLALGWGRMSDLQVLKTLSIRQNNRWFFLQTPKLPIPKKEMMNSASNMHLVPANTDVQNQIDMVKVNQIVQISGKLINIKGENGFRWRTSTSRKDSGNGACELVFVESITVIE